MTNPMAYCGIDCHQCPTFLATQADDDQARLQVVQSWSSLFGLKLEKADINCHGCRGPEGQAPEGQVLFGHCRHCGIRGCARQKDLDNCAVCREYPCPELAAFFALMPQARQNLESIRQGRDA